MYYSWHSTLSCTLQHIYIIGSKSLPNIRHKICYHSRFHILLDSLYTTIEFSRKLKSILQHRCHFPRRKAEHRRYMMSHCNGGRDQQHKYCYYFHKCFMGTRSSIFQQIAYSCFNITHINWQFSRTSNLLSRACIFLFVHLRMWILHKAIRIFRLGGRSCQSILYIKHHHKVRSFCSFSCKRLVLHKILLKLRSFRLYIPNTQSKSHTLRSLGCKPYRLMRMYLHSNLRDNFERIYCCRGSSQKYTLCRNILSLLYIIYKAIGKQNIDHLKDKSHLDTLACSVLRAGTWIHGSSYISLEKYIICSTEYKVNSFYWLLGKFHLGKLSHIQLRSNNSLHYKFRIHLRCWSRWHTVWHIPHINFHR